MEKQPDFIADDEDNNLHLQDAEIITTTVSNVGSVFNQQKFISMHFSKRVVQEEAVTHKQYRPATIKFIMAH